MDEAPPFDPDLLLEHHDFVRGLAKAILFDDHRVDDVVQEAWLTALRRPPRQPAALRAWLATVVRNLARRTIRTQERSRARERRTSREEAVPSVAELAAREATRRRVVDEMLGLDEPFRSAVYLRYFEGLTAEQIGRRLGVPGATVRSRLKRALERLRHRLDGEHGGDRRSWCLALVPLAIPARGAHAAVFSSALARWLLAGAAVVVIAVAWYALRPAPAPAPVRSGPPVADSPLPPAEPPEAVDEPPADGATLRGRVVAAGKPLRDAYVYCFPVDRPDLVETVDRTGDAGDFAFRFEGPVVLGAARPGHRPARRSLSLERGRAVEVELELAAGGGLDVVVVDGASGRPVADAEVLLLRAGSSGGVDGYNKAFLEAYSTFFQRSQRMRSVGVLDWSDLMMATARYSVAIDVPIARTDARGETRLEGLPEGDLDLVVSHASFAPARARGQAAGPVRVALDRGGHLTVLAPLVDGRTAEGYACRVATAASRTLGISLANVDPEGRVVFRNLPPGPVTVAITESRSRPRDDRAWSWEGNHRPLAGGRAVVVEGEETVLDLTAARAARLQGLVAIDQTRCPGWQVELTDGRGGIGGLVEAGKTGADGRFLFENVLPGVYTLTLWGDKGNARREVVVAEGQELVELQVEPGSARIVGCVLGDGGDPVAGAGVLLVPPLSPRLGSISLAAVLETIRTAADTTETGEFSLNYVEGGRHRIVAVWEGRLAIREIEVTNGQRHEVELDLSAADRDQVRIRLTDGAGAPIRGHLFLLDERGGLGTALPLQGPGFNPSRGAASEYEFTLPRGAYRLAAFAAGFATIRAGLQVNGDDEVVLRLARGVQVFLELETTGGAFSGAAVELCDEDGFTVPSALTLMGALWQSRTPRTDGFGRVSFPRVGPGRYSVWVDGKEAGRVVVGNEPVQAKLLVPDR
ncbi:MAG: sigma-70 family RNA polymerase sigma factor [Planctomycetota bacterium]|jgi:RNA polymerase sigma-70 factor (ECF subfamily)